jgi:hypothetical protein
MGDQLFGEGAGEQPQTVVDNIGENEEQRVEILQQ